MIACAAPIVNALTNMSYATDRAAEAEARGEAAEAALWMHVDALVDGAPPLAVSQRDRLRVLIRRRAPVEPGRTGRAKSTNVA